MDIITVSLTLLPNVLKLFYKKDPKLFTKIILGIILLAILCVFLIILIFLAITSVIVNVFKISSPVAAALVSGIILIFNGNFLFLQNQQLTILCLERQKAEKKQDELAVALGELRGGLNYLILLSNKSETETEKIEELVCNLIKQSEIHNFKKITNDLEKVASEYKQRKSINLLVYKIRDDVIKISNEFNNKKEEFIRKKILADKLYEDFKYIYEALFGIEKIDESCEADGVTKRLKQGK